MSELQESYITSTPIAGSQPIDLFLSDTERDFIRRWRQIRNAAMSSSGPRMIVLNTDSGTWFVSGREENLR